MTAEESTILETSGQDTHDNADRPEQRPPTPLPYAQLLAVYLIQIAEPITALCIYPFINQFIRETGITGGNEKKTGYYAGIIESTFFLSESLTVVPWGYMSDRLGRRPIILMAPLGLTIAMFIFGLSTTFWPLVLARCMQGIFNGNIGVGRSMIGEMTDASNRGDAFAFIPLVWSVGSTTAHLTGGLLSNPAKRWPDGIGRIALLQKHPYLLPCAAAGSLAFVAFVLACLLLKETLPSLVEKDKQKRRLKNASDDSILSPTEQSPLLGAQLERDQDEPLSPAPKVPQFRDAFIRPILLTVFSTGFLAFIDMCHFSLLPLMWSTSIPLGGLGLDPLRIGATLGTYGFVNALIQVNVTGRLLRRFGAERVFRVSVRSLLLCFTMYPTMKFFAQRAGRVDAFVVAGIIVQLLCQTMIYFAYGSIQVLVVESVPEGGPLGTANGLAQMASSGCRTIAPTLATSLFAVSLERNLAGGNLVYYVFLGVTCLGIYGTSFLPKRNTAVQGRP